MFDDILVATDETDVAESPIQYRSAWLARLVDHLGAVVRELVFQTADPDVGGPDAAESVYVPTDNATAYAMELAAREDARLHVLFTIDTRKYDTSIESAVEPLEARAHHVLDGVVDRAERAGVDVSCSTELGTPSDLVVGYVEHHGVDLVVMNVHGRHRLHRLIFGTTAKDVVDRLEVPVLLVPLAEPGSEAGGTAA